MRKVFADWMLLVGLALLFLLVFGSFATADDGSFQAAPKPMKVTPGVPPGTPDASATVAVSNCGVSATAYAQADTLGDARFPRARVFFDRLRHPFGGRFALRGGCG